MPEFNAIKYIEQYLMIIGMHFFCNSHCAVAIVIHVSNCGTLFIGAVLPCCVGIVPNLELQTCVNCHCFASILIHKNICIAEYQILITIGQ